MAKSTRLRDARNSRRGRVTLALAMSAAIIPSAYGQTPGKKLASVEFTGLQRLKREQLLSASGLELGQDVDPAVLNAAAQRLLDSGLVRKLSYRLHTTGNQATVTFQIEEDKSGESKVVFDNFIWFTDDEIGDAIRRDVPSFHGTAPNAGNLTDAIARVLQRLLEERKLAGKVEYMASTAEGTAPMEHVFSVKGPKLPVCAVHFPGAQDVSEDRLIKASQSLLGQEFSRVSTSAFARPSLGPFYRELGHLQAAFGQPLGKPISTATCKDGVDVTIAVSEGAVYSWDSAEWSGNKVLPTEELNKLLDMKAGEIANGLKFDKGLEAVRKAYGRKGYLTTGARPTADFDDATRKVSYRIELKEGPQYHMGNLVVKGLSENFTNYLRGKWEMLRGDVYDTGYAEEFFKTTFPEVFRKIVEERQTQGKPKPKFTTAQKPNRADLTVDVTFEFSEQPAP